MSWYYSDMPTWGDISQLIIACAIAFNVWQGWRNGRKIDVVHDATNSMKDALVESTSKESYARGVKQGEASSININHRED
jgi:uncharacterized membrane protein YccC